MNVNTVPPLPAAVSTICAYPLAKVKGTMSVQEYLNYKQDWYFFNTVWSYNYTISTLNGLASSSPPTAPPGTPLNSYKFMRRADLVSYSNGQVSHTEVYPSASFKNF